MIFEIIWIVVRLHLIETSSSVQRNTSAPQKTSVSVWAEKYTLYIGV